MRSHSFRLNKKTKKLATRSAFAEKVRQDGIFVIDSLKLNDNKTRNLNSILKKLELNEKILIVTDEINNNLKLASRNLPKVHILSYRSLNIYEMMRHKKVVFIRDALDAFKERIGE